MADNTDAPIATPAKKAKAAKPKKAKTAPTHPKVKEMVNAAIGNLKERGGSSLKAIKKYVASHYKVDAEKLSPHIKKYLKSSVSDGSLLQPKGKGASGSFKLRTAGSSEKKPVAKKPKSAAVKKATTPKKPKSAATKKAAKPKSRVAPKAKAASPVKKAAPAKKRKAPAKAKATPKKAVKPKAKKSPAKKAAGRKAKK